MEAEPVKKAISFLPDLKEHFKFTDEEIQETSEHDERIYKFNGGEKAALQRLEYYAKNPLQTYA